MSTALPTYSASDLNFSLTHPYVGAITAAGIAEKGWTKMVVRMSVDQTVMKTGADGATAVSAIPGDWGEIEFEMWQTSTLHKQLLTWYNSVKAARDQGDVSQWASALIFVQNIVDGSSHNCVGCAPTKVPDKTYETEAQTVGWVFRCANITHLPGAIV